MYSLFDDDGNDDITVFSRAKLITFYNKNETLQNLLKLDCALFYSGNKLCCIIHLCKAALKQSVL